MPAERKNAKRTAIEQQWGKPFWELIRQFAEDGKSRRQTAEAIGYQWQQFCKILRDNEDKDPFTTYGTVANYVRDTGEQFSAALKRMQGAGYTYSEAAREIGYTAVSSLKYAMAARGIELEFSPVVAKPKKPRKEKRVLAPKVEETSRRHPWRQQAQQELMNRGYTGG